MEARYGLDMQIKPGRDWTFFNPSMQIALIAHRRQAELPLVECSEVAFFDKLRKHLDPGETLGNSLLSKYQL